MPSTSIWEGSTSTQTRWLPTRNPEAAQYEVALPGRRYHRPPTVGTTAYLADHRVYEYGK